MHIATAPDWYFDTALGGELSLGRQDSLHLGVSLARSSVRSIGFARLLTLLVRALTLTVTGCGGSKSTREPAIERYSQQLRDAVSAKVSDERRKAQMLLVVDQLKALHLRFNQETADFVESYRKLNVDYDSMRPAFD